MGTRFLYKLKRTKISASLLALEEIENGVVHPANKKTITKVKKPIEDLLLKEMLYLSAIASEQVKPIEKTQGCRNARLS